MEALGQYLQGNPLVAVLAVFAGGLLSAASPCVLALMPMVIGYVGGHSQGDRRKAMTYSLLFALGLSLTFTALGAIAGLFGRLMGDIGGYWYWIVAGVAILMGLALMGVFEVRVPFANKMQTRRKGAVGAFLLGLLFGAVSSPCATPVLVIILTFVATQGQVMYGVGLLLVYSIGHCALIILAGVVTGFVEAFVQARGVQNFSTWSKRLSGGLVVAGGLYILYISL